MEGQNPITNTEDVIDSRDVIARIEYLQTDLVPEVPDDYPVRELDQDETAEAVNPAQCQTCGRRWDDGVSTSMTPTPAGRCPFEAYHLGEDERTELVALLDLAEQASGYAEDWRYGVTLIRDSYFEDYARELAEDIGAINRDASWPAYCIDWERAARELQMDYTSVDFDGVTYWVR